MNLSDEHLNYWGEIYCRANLIDYELPFAVFVRDPWKWLVSFGINDPETPVAGRGREAAEAPIKPTREMLMPALGPAKIYSLDEARERRERRRAAASAGVPEHG